MRWSRQGRLDGVCGIENDGVDGVCGGAVCECALHETRPAMKLTPVPVATPAPRSAPRWPLSTSAYSDQGLALVHFSAQRNEFRGIQWVVSVAWNTIDGL